MQLGSVKQRSQLRAHGSELSCVCLFFIRSHVLRPLANTVSSYQPWLEIVFLWATHSRRPADPKGIPLDSFVPNEGICHSNGPERKSATHFVQLRICKAT